MNINFGYTDGATNVLHHFRERVFTTAADNLPRANFRNLKKGTEWVRLSGFPIGAACALAAIIFRTTAVAESLFKGFANISGAPFSDRFEALKGFKQLFVDLPINVAKLIFLMPLEVVGDLVLTPLAMLDSPQYAIARLRFENEMKVEEPRKRDYRQERFDHYPQGPYSEEIQGQYPHRDQW
jgi:hypothetical protein